jgi:CRISPR/Cas system-associated exonuclease Cas4 (RecB family)
MNPRISKTGFLEGMQCPLRLWRRVHNIAELPEDEVDSVREDAAVFVDGALEMEQLAERWLEVDSQHCQVRLVAGDIHGVVDFLIPEGGGYRLIEVKASSGPKPIHFHDLAFQWTLAERAGFKVVAAEVIHLDKNFVYPGGELDLEHLLVRVDVTEEVRELLPHVDSAITEMIRVLNGTAPAVLPGPSCKVNRDSKVEVRPSTCGHLRKGGLCRENLPKAWLGDVPRVNAGKFCELTGRHSRSVLDLSEEELGKLPPTASLIVQAWLENREVWDKSSATSVLETLEWPLAFVDFEFEPAIPVPPFQGMRPNQKLPFQWAMSIQDAPGESLREVDSFLHESAEDPREAFVSSFLAALPPRGSIVVFNASAESGVLKLYAHWLDGKFAQGCEAAISRFFDLLPLVRSCYASPALNGSYSLKAVAPAMTGEGYDGMEVAGGLVAVLRWRELVAAPTQEKSNLRTSLIEYCNRDSTLMRGILDRVRHEMQG